MIGRQEMQCVDFSMLMPFKETKSQDYYRYLSLLRDLSYLLNSVRDLKLYLDCLKTIDNKVFLKEDEDISFHRAYELQCIIDMDHITSGRYRSLFYLSRDLMIKIESYQSRNKGNSREWLLYQYVSRELPELKKFLCPILLHREEFNIVTSCANSYSQASMLSKHHIKSIIKLFERNGILIYDLENRPDNFGYYNDNYVILDYADWEFTWEKELRDYKYNQGHNNKEYVEIKGILGMSKF